MVCLWEVIIDISYDSKQHRDKFQSVTWPPTLSSPTYLCNCCRYCWCFSFLFSSSPSKRLTFTLLVTRFPLCICVCVCVNSTIISDCWATWLWTATDQQDTSTGASKLETIDRLHTHTYHSFHDVSTNNRMVRWVGLAAKQSKHYITIELRRMLIEVPSSSSRGTPGTSSSRASIRREAIDLWLAWHFLDWDLEWQQWGVWHGGRHIMQCGWCRINVTQVRWSALFVSMVEI